MSRKQMIGLWGCVAYFGFVLFAHFSTWSWGNLGINTSGDPLDPEARLKKSMALVEHWTTEFSSLYRWLALGVLLLLIVVLWCPRGARAADGSASERSESAV